MSKIIEKSIEELKKMFEKINKNKEELKMNIQKIFTTIRTKINEREGEILSEIDKKYDELYFKEDIIKEGIKLPKKIKESIERGNIIDKEWNENKNELNVLLNDCIIIENDITKIDLINESINKSNNNINSEIKYNPEQELNKILDIIKSLGKLITLPVITEKFNISQNPMIITPNNNLTQQKVTMDPCPIMKNEIKFIILLAMETGVQLEYIINLNHSKIKIMMN